MLAVSCIRQVVVVSVPATAPIGITELPSTVTAPFLANAFPFNIDAPLFCVIDVNARMFPLKFPSIVAELPTCQKTLEARAPPIRVTLLLAPVVRVVAIWKIKMSVAVPVSVRVPVIPKVPAAEV